MDTVGPHPVTGVAHPVADRQRKCCVNLEAEVRAMHLQAKDCWPAQKLGRGLEPTLPQALGGSSGPAPPPSQTSCVQVPRGNSLWARSPACGSRCVSCCVSPRTLMCHRPRVELALLFLC